MLTNDDGFWHQPNRKTAILSQEEECAVYTKKLYRQTPKQP